MNSVFHGTFPYLHSRTSGIHEEDNNSKISCSDKGGDVTQWEEYI